MSKNDYEDDVKLPAAVAAGNNNDNNNINDDDDDELSSSSLSLSLLPNEIMKRITMYLPSKDAINVSLTSKHIKSSLLLSVLPSRKFDVSGRIFVGHRGIHGGRNNNAHAHNDDDDDDRGGRVYDIDIDDDVNKPQEAFRIPLLYNQSSNTIQTHSVTLSMNWCIAPPSFAFGDHHHHQQRNNNNNNNSQQQQTITRKIWLIGRPKDMERTASENSQLFFNRYFPFIGDHFENNNNNNNNNNEHQGVRNDNNDGDDNNMHNNNQKPPSSLLSSPPPPFDGGRIVYEFTSTIPLRLRDAGAPEHLRIPFCPEENEIYEIWCGCGTIKHDDDLASQQQQQQPPPPNTFFFRDAKIDTLIFDVDTDYTFSHNYKSLLKSEIRCTQDRQLSEILATHKNIGNRPRFPAMGFPNGMTHSQEMKMLRSKNTIFMEDLLLSTCQSLRQRLLEASSSSSSSSGGGGSSEQHSSSTSQSAAAAIDPFMSSFLDQYGLLKSIVSFRCIEDMIQTERSDLKYSEQRLQRLLLRRQQQQQQQRGATNRNGGAAANGNNDNGRAFVGGNITITVGGGVIGGGEDQQFHQFNIGEGQPLNFGGGNDNNNNGPGQPQVFVHRVGGGDGDGDGLAGLGGGLGAFLNGIINGGVGGNGGGGQQQPQQQAQQQQQQQRNVHVDQAAAAAAAPLPNDDDDDEIGVVVDVDMEEEEREDRQQEPDEQRTNSNAPTNGNAAVDAAAAAAQDAAAAAQDAAAAAQRAANAAQEAARDQGMPRAGGGFGGGGNNPDMNGILGGIPPEIQNMLPPGLLENIIMGDGAGVGGGIAVGGMRPPRRQQQGAAGAGAQNNAEEGEGPQAEVHVVEVPIQIPEGGNPNINIDLPGGAFDGGAQPQVFFGGAEMFGGGGPGGGGVPPGAEGMIFQQIAQMMGGNGGNMAMGGMGMGMGAFPFPPPPQNDDDDDSIPEID